MRILFALHTWHPEGRGGTEQHARSLARTLARKGHQLGIFTRCGDPSRPEYEVRTEWEGPTSITRINNCWREAPNFEWIYRNRAVHEAFMRELDSFKPDLVHVHHLTGLSTTILEEVKLRGLPLVMTFHDFWTVCPRGQRMTKELELCETVNREKCFTCLKGLWPHMFDDRVHERTVVDQRGHLAPENLANWERYTAYALNLCDVMIAPSEFHRERMLDFRLDGERLVALPHGLDQAAFDGRLRSNTRPKRIGFIGSVIPVKGVHVLVDAFRLLGREDISLEIYGEIRPHHDDKDYGERLMKQCAGDPNIHFHGAYDVDNVGRLLDKLDVLVVPSLWWETFCLTIREGLLAGIPVLASDIGAMREALDGERDGILFRCGDAEDLREKLDRVLTDDLWRERYYNRGSTVKSMEAYCEEVEALYAQAVRVSRRRKRTLVVAPPAFPSLASQHGQAVNLPWERIAISMEQHGLASVGLSSKAASDERPELALNLDLQEGERQLGHVRLRVDLSALSERASRGVQPTLPEPLPPRGADAAPAVPPPATDAPRTTKPAPVHEARPAEPPPPQQKPAPRPGVRREAVQPAGGGRRRIRFMKKSGGGRP
jgi:glycosyltransferase involved in cell wall biosynthesis